MQNDEIIPQNDPFYQQHQFRVIESQMRLSEHYEKQRIEAAGMVGRKKIAEDFQDRNAMRSIVFAWQGGYLYYGFSRPDGITNQFSCNMLKVVCTPAITNACILEIGPPVSMKMLKILLSTGDEVCFEHVDRLRMKNIRERLTQSGVCLNVSGRLEQELISQLFAFLVRSAKTQKVPGARGWNTDCEGQWHFHPWKEASDGEELKTFTFHRLLDTMFINAPLLAGWGMDLEDQVMNLVIDKVDRAKFYEAFHKDNIAVIQVNSLLNRTAKQLRTCKLVFVEVSNTVETGAVVRLVQERLGDPEKNWRLIVLVSEKPLAYDTDDAISVVLNAAEVKAPQIKLQQLVPEATRLFELKEKIEQNVSTAKNVASRTFQAAAVIYAFVTGEQEVVLQAREYAERAELLANLDGIEEIVAEEMRRYVLRTTFCEVYDRSRVPEKALSDYAMNIFFDDDNMYIGSELFKCMMAKIVPDMGINTLKSALKRTGFFKEGGSGYVSKCNLYDEHGSFHRVDKFRIDRKRTFYEGMDFIDLCSINKKS